MTPTAPGWTPLDSVCVCVEWARRESRGRHEGAVVPSVVSTQAASRGGGQWTRCCHEPAPGGQAEQRCGVRRALGGCGRELCLPDQTRRTCNCGEERRQQAVQAGGRQRDEKHADKGHGAGLDTAKQARVRPSLGGARRRRPQAVPPPVSSPPGALRPVLHVAALAAGGCVTGGGPRRGRGRLPVVPSASWRHHAVAGGGAHHAAPALRRGVGLHTKRGGGTATRVGGTGRAKAQWADTSSLGVPLAGRMP